MTDRTARDALNDITKGLCTEDPSAYARWVTTEDAVLILAEIDRLNAEIDRLRKLRSYVAGFADGLRKTQGDRE